MEKRYFITGGAGFIGSSTVDFLLRKHYEVYTIDDLSTGTIANLAATNHVAHHHFFQQNALDFDWDSHLQVGDCIIHLAATVGVEYVAKDALFTASNNLDVTQHLLEKCRQHQCELVFASTSEVYGNHDRDYSSEQDPLHLFSHHGGRSAYTLSKLYGEFLCQEYARKYKLGITVLRLFNTIGPRQSSEFGMVVPRFIQHALRGERLLVFGEGDQTRSFCHVSDTVRAIYHLSQTRGHGEVYNIGNDVAVSILELAQYIKRVTKSASPIVLCPYPAAREGQRDIKHRKPNLTKIADAIGWLPQVPWQEAVAELATTLGQPQVAQPAYA